MQEVSLELLKPLGETCGLTLFTFFARELLEIPLHCLGFSDDELQVDLQIENLGDAELFESCLNLIWSNKDFGA